VMWNPGDPPKPIAVFDWEMSTIGDPLADLGWLLSYWPDPDDDRANPGMATMLPERGLLTRREMLDRYEAKTGRKMKDFPFYQAFAIFKLAIIMEGSYGRFLLGQADDPLFDQMRERVPALADSAWKVCQAAK
jgi:aminoglycoside phosphotransferase (APT) family kinase protein